MEPFAGLGALVAFATLLAMFVAQPIYQRIRTASVARALDLAPSGWDYEGTFEGLPVRMSNELRLKHRKFVLLCEVSVPVDAPDLSLRIAPMEGTGVRIGDPVLGRFTFSGDPPAFARLTPEVRADLASLADRCTEVTLSEGSLRICKDDSSAAFRQDLATMHRIASALASVEPDDHERIRVRATTDPVPGVRRRFLAMALDVDPALYREIGRALMDDPDSMVRFEAAIATDSVPHLLKACADRELLVGLRRQAAFQLGSASWGVRVGAAGAMLDDVRLHRDAAMLLDAPEDERPLVDLVSRTSEPEALISAAGLLALVGTPAALPALLGARERVGVLRTGVRKAIDDAVAVIREGSPAQGGSLSLTEPLAEGGEVSLAEPRVGGGALSAAVRRRTPEG